MAYAPQKPTPPEYVGEISELTPGLQFEYKVWAEKSNQFGDFPNNTGRFKFELHGSWVVAATIIDDAGTHCPAEFTVYDTEDFEPIITVVRPVLPRTNTPGMDTRYQGEFPIQEGFATKLGEVALIEPHVPGLKFDNRRAAAIPARNPFDIRLSSGNTA